MKKGLFFILMIFTLCAGYSQGFKYGIGVGLNYSSLMLNKVPEAKTDYKVGVQFNVILKNKLNDRLGLRFEPGYAQRGTVMSDANHSDTRINLSYFILSLSLEYSPVERLSVMIGPEYAIRLAAKSKTEGQASDVKAIYDSRYDLGVMAGVSFELMHNLALELRYNRGFVSTVSNLQFIDEYGNDYGKASLINRGVTFSISYLL